MIILKMKINQMIIMTISMINYEKNNLNKNFKMNYFIYSAIAHHYHFYLIFQNGMPEM